MVAEQKALLIARALVLITALGVIGLGAWSKIIVHDVEVRGDTVVEAVQISEDDLRVWRQYFTAVLESTMRIWISIAGCSLAFLTMLLVILSTRLPSVEMPSSVRVPLELLSFCGMAAAFGCTISLSMTLGTFNDTLNDMDSADLKMFIMLVILSKALVITAGTGALLNMVTVITAMVQACLRLRAKESCSFEPTASALGMTGQPAIVPQVVQNRVPTMYDPNRAASRNDRRASDDEEKGLIGKEGGVVRADSGLSGMSRSSIYSEKGWPLGQGRQSKQAPVRPARPWSESPQQKRGLGQHAL